MSIEKEFRPKIVAFCCNWCSYAGADLAGSSRLAYPADVKIIRRGKVRRAKLYYLRDRVGKASKVKEKIG